MGAAIHSVSSWSEWKVRSQRQGGQAVDICIGRGEKKDFSWFLAYLVGLRVAHVNPERYFETGWDRRMPVECAELKTI